MPRENLASIKAVNDHELMTLMLSMLSFSAANYTLVVCCETIHWKFAAGLRLILI